MTTLSFPVVPAPVLAPPALSLEPADNHPGVSVDCVIFGFHDAQLKVLLLETTHDSFWRVTGGFVQKHEDVDEAADAMLRARTGLTNIFLRQFHLFGGAKRNMMSEELLASNYLYTSTPEQQAWLLQRFVSAGYYALVDYTKVEPHVSVFTKACAWWELSSLPPLIFDHQYMIDKALEAMRLRLRYEPIGANLLPEKFTMPDLQKLYEAILGRPLDRRNFQRKMRSYGTLDALEERRRGGAHKSPRLYSFNVAAYELALQQGLQDGW